MFFFFYHLISIAFSAFLFLFAIYFGCLNYLEIKIIPRVYTDIQMCIFRKCFVWNFICPIYLFFYIFWVLFDLLNFPQNIWIVFQYDFYSSFDFTRGADIISIINGYTRTRLIIFIVSYIFFSSSFFFNIHCCSLFFFLIKIIVFKQMV